MNRPWLKDVMTIKKGKFYLDDKEVPAEHGNKKQIELLKRIEEMQNEGFCPEIAIKQVVSMEFDCVCGCTNEFQFHDIDIDDDPQFVLDGETDHCHYCGMQYKVYRDEDEGLMLKLLGYDKPKKP